LGVRSALLAGARQIGRVVGDGVADSRQAAVYLRQLLRGNHGEPSLATVAPGGPSPSPPVLLIHGYLATRGSVHLLERRLTERNHVVMTYPLGPVHLGDIHDSASFISGKVESLVAQTGVPKVDIVAHSMGGLVALDYVKRRGGWRRVRRLVLLGTPIHGTWSAVFGLLTAPLGRGSLQLLPGSAFLRDLGRAPLPPGPEVVAVAGDRDWLAPSRTTVLEGVRHLDVPTGHTGLLVDETVADIVSEILSAPERGAPADEPAPGRG
jgi:triacylglycerol lipase